VQTVTKQNLVTDMTEESPDLFLFRYKTWLAVCRSQAWSVAVEIRASKLTDFEKNCRKTPVDY
jgi:hypothetical protein